MTPDSSSSPPAELCGECGQPFPNADLLTYGPHRFCLACKPAFLERLQTGAPLDTGLARERKVWRSNKQVILAREAELPDRCFKCAEPCQGAHETVVHFHYRKLLVYTSIGLLLAFPFSINEPMILLFLLILLVAVVYSTLATRQPVKFTLPLCTRHKSIRTRNRLIGVAGTGLALLGLALFCQQDYSVRASAGGVFVWFGLLVLFVVSLFYGIFQSRVVYVARVTETHLALDYSGEAFRASLPEWPDLNP